MDWRECKIKDFIKEGKVDIHLIESLKESSKKKIETLSYLPLNEVTATSKVTIAYDGLREILEALAISKGYKIYNHDCYVAFLKEILFESNMSQDFDEYRKIRNKINYYGKEISIDEAKVIIENMITLTLKIKNKFFSK